MTSKDDEDRAPTPQRAIRRFDVFAEYSRQEQEAKGYPEDEAKGYGVWLAKVVAARRLGRNPSHPAKQNRRPAAEKQRKSRSSGPLATNCKPM
jgi:hypothetical protein